jgi:hypothetical protein
MGVRDRKLASTHEARSPAGFVFARASGPTEDPKL